MMNIKDVIKVAKSKIEFFVENIDNVEYINDDMFDKFEKYLNDMEEILKAKPMEFSEELLYKADLDNSDLAEYEKDYKEYMQRKERLRQRTITLLIRLEQFESHI